MLISGDDRRSLTAQRQRAAQPAMSASQQRVQRRAFRQTIHQHDEPHAQPSACLPASTVPGGVTAPGDARYPDRYQLAGHDYQRLRM